MREKEMRSAIDKMCAELDRAAKRTAKVVFPLVLGAGLVGTVACDDETETNQTTTSSGTTSGTGGSAVGGGGSTAAGGGGSTAAGGGGSTAVGGNGGAAGQGGVGGAQLDYMAPDP